MDGYSEVSECSVMLQCFNLYELVAHLPNVQEARKKRIRCIRCILFERLVEDFFFLSTSVSKVNIFQSLEA